MSDISDTGQRAGWELIWRGEKIPPKYLSIAAPSPTVVELARMLPSGGSVLDIGCGLGRHCLYLGKQGFQVAGMDISPTGVETTRAVCAEHNITFDGKVADMQALPWPDAVFNGAFSIASLHHHLRPNLVKALDEVRRVLKPGGLFAADFPSTASAQYQSLRKQVAAGELSEPEPNTFVDERPEVDEDDDAFLPHHFCDEDDLRDLMQGFEVLSMQTEINDTGKPGRWVVFARKPLVE